MPSWSIRRWSRPPSWVKPDADVGQRIAAFVVLAPGFVEHPQICEEIRATVRGLLAP